jgi:maleate isomerase
MLKRVGMIVPSLNTIAEDDFRVFSPAAVRYHVHRIRLRKEGGRVTPNTLARAHLEAVEEATYLKDMSPDVIAFNCTGASVAYGKDCDTALAGRMTSELGVPSTNTMVAIKQALTAVGAKDILHVCPFDDDSLRIERESLLDAGFPVRRSVGLQFKDAKVAALMEPARIAEIAREHVNDSYGAVLLSCANVRAFEAVETLERELGRPVITSNQAMLWAVLRLVGWTGTIAGGGRLFEHGLPK